VEGGRHIIEDEARSGFLRALARLELSGAEPAPR